MRASRSAIVARIASSSVPTRRAARAVSSMVIVDPSRRRIASVLRRRMAACASRVGCWTFGADRAAATKERASRSRVRYVSTLIVSALAMPPPIQ
jgi:hypothetical protein